MRKYCILSRNVLLTIKIRKADWIGYTLHSNCLLKHTVERKIRWKDISDETTRKKTKKLLYDVKERRGCRRLKKEAPDRTVWKTHFGTGYRPVVGQTAERQYFQNQLKFCG
jgi:hypothetical protein